MNKKYDILWIDDEHGHKDLLPFIIQAESKGIALEGYSNFKQGFEVLENNLLRFDGVLLDALFFMDESSETPNTKGLGASIAKLNELKSKKLFPYFILSGQSSFTEKQNDILEANSLVCYNKKKVLDIKLLLDNIINESKEQETTQLKHKYPNAFSICDNNYIGSKEFSRVFQLVKDIENPGSIINQQDALVPIRKILEAIFEKLNSLGLIPDEIQNNPGRFNGASLFLSAKNYDYKYIEDLIHPVIAESIRYLACFTQDGSHNTGNKLRVDTYLANKNNTYLYQSLCYSILEVLDYLKPFIDDNNDVSINKSKWQILKSIDTVPHGNWIFGTVVRIAENGYGTFQDESNSSTISLMPSMVNEYNLEEKQKIEVITKPSFDGSKTFIDKIRTL